jgi:hypothetical protein
MYLRDADASPPPPTAAEAQFDAGRILGAISPRCGSRCSVETLGQSEPHTWRVRLDVGSWRRCYDLDVRAFGYSSDHGFSGVKAARCRI